MRGGLIFVVNGIYEYDGFVFCVWGIVRGRKNRDEKLDEKKERKSVEKFKIDLK